MFGKYFTFIVLISNYNNGQLMFYHYSQAKICILRRNPKGASENELNHPWPRPVGVKMYVKKKTHGGINHFWPLYNYGIHWSFGLLR